MLNNKVVHGLDASLQIMYVYVCSPFVRDIFFLFQLLSPIFEGGWSIRRFGPLKLRLETILVLFFPTTSKDFLTEGPFFFFEQLVTIRICDFARYDQDTLNSVVLAVILRRRSSFSHGVPKRFATCVCNSTFRTYTFKLCFTQGPRLYAIKKYEAFYNFFSNFRLKYLLHKSDFMDIKVCRACSIQLFISIFYFYILFMIVPEYL